VARRIALTWTKCGTTATAELLDRHAPKTCEAIWQALAKPAVNLGIHAMYVGREIAFDLPAANKGGVDFVLPPENQIILPLPGDICFKYYRPYELNMPGMGNPQEDDVADLIIIYGRNARLFSSQGWIPCNLFAQIKENLDGFAKVSASIRYEGIKELRVSRAE
jgi:hypothetical protein